MHTEKLEEVVKLARFLEDDVIIVITIGFMESVHSKELINHTADVINVDAKDKLSLISESYHA